MAPQKFLLCFLLAWILVPAQAALRPASTDFIDNTSTLRVPKRALEESGYAGPSYFRGLRSSIRFILAEESDEIAPSSSFLTQKSMHLTEKLDSQFSRCTFSAAVYFDGTDDRLLGVGVYTNECDAVEPPLSCARTGGSVKESVQVEGMLIHAMIFFVPQDEALLGSVQSLVAYAEMTEEAFEVCADYQPAPLNLSAVVECMLGRFVTAARPRGVLIAPELSVEFSAPDGQLLIPFPEDEDGNKGYTIMMPGSSPSGPLVEHTFGPSLFLVVLPPAM